MSREDNRSMINAYEKMLQDGSAFREIDTTMHTNPSVSEASGTISDNPLGDRVDNNNDNIVPDEYAEFDTVMEQRMNNLRQKAGMGGGNSGGGSNEIQSLKNRIKKLEEAITLVMETQTKLIEGR